MACATGSRAPKSTITGQSMELYIRRKGSTLVTITKRTPKEKLTAAGIICNAAKEIDSNIMLKDVIIFLRSGLRMDLAASGAQPDELANSVIKSLGPCIRRTSP